VRPASREVTVSCRGFCCPSSSASLASGAPPTPFVSGLGVFLGVPDSRNCRPVSSSRGVRLLFRARLRRIRPFPFSDPARLRAPERSRDSGPPLLGFLLPSKRLYVGCPCSPGQPRGQPGRRRLPHLRRCRPQGSCPSRRFKLRTRFDTSPCGARRSPWRPDASRPCYMPLASLWSCPTELSLPEEPFPLSRDLASLRVRFRLPPARRDRALHGRFPRRASSLPVARPEANRDA